MKRLSRGIRWTAHYDAADKRVHLHIGEDAFTLRPSEAVMLANTLVDASEEADG